jgi:hypothetical protein
MHYLLIAAPRASFLASAVQKCGAHWLHSNDKKKVISIVIPIVVFFMKCRILFLIQDDFLCCMQG